MPVLALLHVLVAIYFAVHAVRHGRNAYWLFILLAFPFLGSVVYFFAEYLPEMRHSRVGRKAVGAVQALVDPKRELREAQADFERTPTVEHRARLADALLARGDVDAALAHYRECASGPYAKDAKFRLGLARAQLAAARPAEAVGSLRSLFADEPERRRGEPALLLAQALSDAGDPAADAAFDEALRLHESTETSCAYGLHLARNGRDAQAKRHLEEVMRQAQLGTAASREINQPSIDRARAALAEIDARAARAG